MATIQHKLVQSGDNHSVVSFDVSTALARDGLTVVSSDIGKICHVQSDDSFFALTNFSPVIWSPLSGPLAPVATSGAYGSLTGTPVIPTTTSQLTNNSGFITSAGSVASATTATTAGTCTGNAATVTTNANLTGPVTSVGNATAIGADAITNAMIAANGVTAGTYTSVTVDAKGRVTNGTSPTIASLTTANTWTAAQRGAVTALTSGTTITPNFALTNNFSLTAQQSFTLANPTNLVAGQSGLIIISQDGVGNRVITWGGYFVAGGGTKPVLTTIANAVDYISYYVESATRIFVSITSDVK